MNKNILITGGSGLIGTRLTELLNEKGHRVAHLSRTRRSGNAKTFLWDIDKHQIDGESLKHTDSIIHLAGANIGDTPWTKEGKDKILRSRIDSTLLLYEALKKGDHTVKCFVSASGINFYEIDAQASPLSENATPGTDFLASVVRQWRDPLIRLLPWESALSKSGLELC